MNCLRTFISVMLCTAALTLPHSDAIAADRPAPGEAMLLETLPDLVDLGGGPEGIALDSQGNIFVGLRRVEGGILVSEILRIDLDGDVGVLSGLPDAPPGTQGVLGLATDQQGNVYAAHASFDPATRGVYRIGADGSDMERIPGSELMLFPNALSFDANGHLYATDSATGSVWRFARHGPAPEQPWLQDALLAPVNPADPILPPVGANGIDFVPPDRLYIANTQGGWIVGIGIATDGSAQAPVIISQALELLTIDGLAADAMGHLHGVVPGFRVLNALFGLPASPLVRIDPDTGFVTPTVTGQDAEVFDTPLSVAFGAGARDHKSVFATNGALRIPGLIENGVGPSVVQAGVGVPGRPW